MMLFKKKIFLVTATFFLLFSCTKEQGPWDKFIPPSPPPPPPPAGCNGPITATTTLQYNDSTCPSTGGCALSFTCDPSLQNQTIWSKLTSNLSKIFRAPVSTPITINTLTINQPALLQASAGAAPTNWYTSSIDCTTDGTNINCPAFLPIASDFQIVGTLGTQSLTLNVTVDNQLTPGSTTQCGQVGTTVERMFDCSMRVENFAGFGTGTGVAPGFTAFVPGNPDPNWFLVSCPGTDNQACFWLSPVMSSSNPALGADQFDSNGVPMSSYNGSRFLWSGTSGNSGNGYNFFEANGKDPRNTAGNPDSSYDYYPGDDYEVMFTFNGPIYRPGSSSSPTIDNSFYFNIWNAVSYPASLCQTMSLPDVTLLPGSAYQWQMPSYPMIMTLTGGYSHNPAISDHASCEPPNGQFYNDNYKGYCNIGPGLSPSSEPLGFRAIDPVPGFSTAYNQTATFWSSSVSGVYGAFTFRGGPGSGSVGEILLYGENGEGQPANWIRCVSATW